MASPLLSKSPHFELWTFWVPALTPPPLLDFFPFFGHFLIRMLPFPYENYFRTFHMFGNIKQTILSSFIIWIPCTVVVWSLRNPNFCSVFFYQIMSVVYSQYPSLLQGLNDYWSSNISSCFSSEYSRWMASLSVYRILNILQDCKSRGTNIAVIHRRGGGESSNTSLQGLT